MKRMHGRRPFEASIDSIASLAVVSLLLASCVSTSSGPAPTTVPPPAVVGVQAKQLQPGYWIARDSGASKTVLDRKDIAAQNARLVQVDPTVHDLEKLPSTLAADEVRSWIGKMSEYPDEELFDADGRKIERSTLDALVHNLALDTLPATQATRHGLIVKRADLRTFPGAQRAYRGDDGHIDGDIDRFQESALFPGTPVVIAHESRDGAWCFVVSPLYSAWVEKRFIAEGPRDQVFAYVHKTPYLVVTGATARTVFTPSRPQVSELQLDMGVRVPVLADWPPGEPVNGQSPYTSHVIELPERADDGSLRFTPALLPRTADTADDYLPLSRANLLRQGFKFLGERYGWGHSYNARDCSGFVSEVYRSFGVQLPRNTRDQAVTTAIDRITFTKDDDHERRLAVLRNLSVGDLVYIPGHVMMVIGHDKGMPYIIHDVTGVSYRDGSGDVKRVVLNGVSVTPLTPLLLSRGPLVDQITSILRVRP
ncbi:MAG TPA: SH3 domain-containing protein [Steroidobacteraceae bacterium]|nr:SH3 domain-containing protein [Steroidobacteraceae bacterium]